MSYLVIAIKVFVFISILNVWFFRFGNPTDWRGGNAISMRDEFEVYGLSESVMYMVGFLKVLSASALLLSIWFPFAAVPSASLMALLMAGAVGMHLKVGDPLKKSLPAFSFLVLSVVIIVYHL
ncbi:DoxX family protein [Robertkochia aurantiaca]|uniref:DoxX family protein n=1 Tax=Robertkochia aurantiaca TaxID=2873700 RepID=UPI001CCB26CA|nr:DoxX family protein [Robertkochia sp. 3YJGBD-33]